MSDEITQDPTDPTVEVPAQEEKKKKKRGGWLLLVLSILLVAGGVTLGVMSFLPRPADATQVKDMEGNVVIPEDPSATTTPFMEQAQMVPDDGGDGFVIPVLKLDVPLGSINEVNGVMNPPNYTNVFVIRNRGVSLENADQGTVYMVTHTLHGGKAPGNIMQANGGVAMKPGDIIKANQRMYEYVSFEIIPKTDLDAHPDLWTNDPGRLVLVTCLSGTYDKNLIIIGKLVQ